MISEKYLSPLARETKLTVLQRHQEYHLVNSHNQLQTLCRLCRVDNRRVDRPIHLDMMHRCNLGLCPLFLQRRIWRAVALGRVVMQMKLMLAHFWATVFWSLLHLDLIVRRHSIYCGWVLIALITWLVTACSLFRVGELAWLRSLFLMFDELFLMNNLNGYEKPSVNGYIESFFII